MHNPSASASVLELPFVDCGASSSFECSTRHCARQSHGRYWPRANKYYHPGPEHSNFVWLGRDSFTRRTPTSSAGQFPAFSLVCFACSIIIPGHISHGEFAVDPRRVSIESSLNETLFPLAVLHVQRTSSRFRGHGDHDARDIHAV